VTAARAARGELQLEPTMSATPDLVLLGNLLVDDIVMRDGRTLMGEAGGAMLYAALAARLWDVRVALVTIAGSDYPARALEALAARGVDLEGVRAFGRPGVRTWLLYEPRVRRVIHHLEAPSHLEVSPTLEDIPAAYAAARAFHLAPMPIERQRELAAGIASGTTGASAPGVAELAPPFVSVDPHEPLTDGSFPAWRSVLDHADAFFPGEDEMGLPPHLDPRSLFGPGGAFPRLRFLALKRGAGGGTLLDRASGDARPWSAPRSPVVDATGAGDAFAGGFLAGWLTHADAGLAIQQGVVSASFAIEDWGSRGLMGATPEAARRRQHEWFGRPRP